MNRKQFVVFVAVLTLALFLSGCRTFTQDKETITSSIGMEFIYVEPGSFMMGSPVGENEGDPEEGSQHKVTLTEGYFLQATEVTQGQWKTVMGDNPSHFKGNDDLPVEEVSWEDAQAFIDKLNKLEGTNGYRLPTEAEWEYACRAGTKTPFALGDTLSTNIANYDGDFKYGSGEKGIDRKRTTVVKTFPANAWGLYDMHGNVHEWCWDWYGAYPLEDMTDPRGPNSGSSRVLRGGSWITVPGNCRSARRCWDYPDCSASSTGFRVVRNAEATAGEDEFATTLPKQSQAQSTKAPVATEEYEFAAMWPKLGQPRHFKEPIAIAVDPSDDVYVADMGNKRILKFTSKGKFIAKWERESYGGLAVDSSGTVYVVDDEKIWKFTPEGKLIKKWGAEGKDDRESFAPVGVAVDASGNVYVAELTDSILKFNPKGKLIAEWTAEGDGDGESTGFYSIEVDRSGNVYVTDVNSHRVHKFSSKGKFITKWGRKGDANGKFNFPLGIAVDGSDNIYVADTNNDRIQKFTSDGKFIAKWGTTGSEEGELRHPLDVAVDSKGNVYVVDAGNNRILVFRPKKALNAPEEKAPK